MKSDATGTIKFIYGVVHRDEFGLSFVHDSTLVTRAHSLKVGQIGANRIEVDITDSVGVDVAASESAGRPIFSRFYSVDLDAPSVVVMPPRFASGHHGSVLARFKVFAPVRRKTYAVVANEAMANHEAKAPRGPSFLARSHQAIQSLCSANIEIFRFIRVGSGKQLPDVELSRIAFTLQVTLSDVLISLFPTLHHRTAVISPQANDAFVRLGADANSTLGPHIAARYPRLGSTWKDGRSNPDEYNAARLAERLGHLFIEASDSAERVAALHDNREETIDMLIIEDWPADLGVCGAVDLNHAHVLHVLLRYLDWLAANSQRKNLFYRFGTETLIEEFDFAGARDLVATVC